MAWEAMEMIGGPLSIVADLLDYLNESPSLCAEAKRQLLDAEPRCRPCGGSSGAGSHSGA